MSGGDRQAESRAGAPGRPSGFLEVNSPPGAGEAVQEYEAREIAVSWDQCLKCGRRPFTTSLWRRRADSSGEWHQAGFL